MRLREKVALLAGVGAGMGRATALLFAQEGATVAVAARGRERLDETVALVRSAGGQAAALVGDISVRSETERMVAEAARTFGRIDILYCGAGGYFEHTRAFADVDDSFWQEVLSNTATGLYNLAHAARPVMKEHGGGSIVVVAASFSVRQEGNAAYAAAKGGVIGLSQNLARELFEDDIRVNVIGAGQFKKEMAAPGLTHPEPRLKRTGTPEDIAHAALYLASEESSWVTGQVLGVDGGVDVGARRLWDYED